VYGSSQSNEPQPNSSKGTMKKTREESFPTLAEVEAEVMAEAGSGRASGWRRDYKNSLNGKAKFSPKAESG